MSIFYFSSLHNYCTFLTHPVEQCITLIWPCDNAKQTHFLYAESLTILDLLMSINMSYLNLESGYCCSANNITSYRVAYKGTPLTRSRHSGSSWLVTTDRNTFLVQLGPEHSLFDHLAPGPTRDPEILRFHKWSNIMAKYKTLRGLSLIWVRM